MICAHSIMGCAQNNREGAPCFPTGTGRRGDLRGGIWEVGFGKWDLGGGIWEVGSVLQLWELELERRDEDGLCLFLSGYFCLLDTISEFQGFGKFWTFPYLSPL